MVGWAGSGPRGSIDGMTDHGDRAEPRSWARPGSEARPGPGVQPGPGGESVTGVRRIRGVGAIIRDGDRLLLVQRGHEPARGQWSVPGGKVERGESDREAVAREIAEETGLVVAVGALVGSVTRPGRPGTVYEIYDYDAILAEGQRPGDARPADDAADLRWVTLAELAALPLTDGLIETLREWGRLPR